jgi:cobalamin biosynthesis protein CbiD
MYCLEELHALLKAAEQCIYDNHHTVPKVRNETLVTIEMHLSACLTLIENIKEQYA